MPKKTKNKKTLKRAATGKISTKDRGNEHVVDHDGGQILTESVLQNWLTPLSTFESITPEAAALAVQAEESHSLRRRPLKELTGLKHLSDAAARSLSKHDGGLYLSGLESLSDAAAQSLSKHKGDLYLSGLESLSDAAAQSLSCHEGELDLSGQNLIRHTRSQGP